MAAEERLSELEAVMARDESRDELRRRAEAAERENERLVNEEICVCMCMHVYDAKLIANR